MIPMAMKMICWVRIRLLSYPESSFFFFFFAIVLYILLQLCLYRVG